MVEVTNLCKDYGPIRAIDHVSFQLKKGDVVGFLGPNGAGKSTTMKIVTGFMAPTSGEARIAGYDVFENPIEVKRRIGYLPETPPVYGDMFVRDYLTYVAELKKVPRDQIRKNVDLVIQKTHLESVSKRLIGVLSKGFKQRVGIAQALVSQPDVLILDEPTVGLDPKQVAEIRELIKELRGQHTIILSTHILSEVQAVCDKAIIINKGKIVAEDSIANLGRLEKGSAALRIRLRQGRDLNPLLAQIPGLIGVVGQGQNWEISFNGDEQVHDQILAKLVESRIGLIEFSPKTLDLEDVFLKLTYGQEVNV
ncbi:MAG: ABC transporter ATP-binding protein [Bdellovibrionales bacterium]